MNYLVRIRLSLSSDHTFDFIQAYLSRFSSWDIVDQDLRTFVSYIFWSGFPSGFPHLFVLKYGYDNHAPAILFN